MRLEPCKHTWTLYNILWHCAMHLDIVQSVAHGLRGRPLMIWGGRRKNRKWIYFSRGNAFWNLFFPDMHLQKKFFLDFLRPHPQIINGRPLRVDLDLGWSRIYWLHGRGQQYFWLQKSRMPLAGLVYFPLRMFICNLCYKKWVSTKTRKVGWYLTYGKSLFETGDNNFFRP